MSHTRSIVALALTHVRTCTYVRTCVFIIAYTCTCIRTSFELAKVLGPCVLIFVCHVYAYMFVLCVFMLCVS